MLIWGDYAFVNEAIVYSAIAPPNENPASAWDTWDFRGLWNQPAIATEVYPPSTPARYPYPWQVYPK